MLAAAKIVLLLSIVWIVLIPNPIYFPRVLAQFSWVDTIEIYRDVTVEYANLRTLTNNETIIIDVKVYVTSTTGISLLQYYELSANGTDFVTVSDGAITLTENTYFGLEPGQKLVFTVKAKPTSSINVGETVTIGMRVELYESSLYIHDVSIFYVETSTNETFADQSMLIWVYLRNEGTRTESSVPVTVDFNGLPLWSQTVTDFAPNTEQIVVFVWEAVGVAHGNYTIRASVPRIPGETDTADNVFIYGSVKVRVMGDINDDGRVDYKDVFLLLKSYGKVQGDPNYNPKADFNHDGRVDYKDVFQLLKKYGYVETFVIDHRVVWGPKTYHVVTESNSTVSSFAFSQPLKEISFNITGPTGARGYCKIKIPVELLHGPFSVLIDGTPTTVFYGGNETHTYLTFYYNFDSDTRRVQIIGSSTMLNMLQMTKDVWSIPYAPPRV